MNSKYKVGDDVLYKGEEYQVMGIQGYAFCDEVLMSYRLAGIEGWIYEDTLLDPGTEVLA